MHKLKEKDSRKCQVEDCQADLSAMKEYHQRYRICEYHLRLESIIRRNQLQRFCQQCGRFHPVEEFEDKRRSCRARLRRHNERRRRKGREPESCSNANTRHQASRQGSDELDDPALSAKRMHSSSVLDMVYGPPHVPTQCVETELPRAAFLRTTLPALCHATPSTGVCVNALSQLGRSVSHPLPSATSSTWRVSVTTECVQHNSNTSVGQGIVQTDVVAPPSHSFGRCQTSIIRSPFQPAVNSPFLTGTEELSGCYYEDQRTMSAFAPGLRSNQVRSQSLPDMTARVTGEQYSDFDLLHSQDNYTCPTQNQPSWAAVYASTLGTWQPR